jgi:hypothetical protein
MGVKGLFWYAVGITRGRRGCKGLGGRWIGPTGYVVGSAASGGVIGANGGVEEGLGDVSFKGGLARAMRQVASWSRQPEGRVQLSTREACRESL